VRNASLPPEIVEGVAVALARALVKAIRREDLDLRAMRLVEVDTLRSDPTISAPLRKAVDAELLERLAAQDLDDPADEQL